MRLRRLRRRRVLLLCGIGLFAAASAQAASRRADPPALSAAPASVVTSLPVDASSTTIAPARHTPEPNSTAPTELPATTAVATTEAATTEVPTTEVPTTEAPTTPLPLPEPPSATSRAASECDPNYSGACVPVDSDVDCAGGSGNGPSYVRGPVRVIGVDIYGLDRDGDGIGCERR